MLDHGWLAAGQVADRTVADPGVRKLDVARFGAAELSSGAPNVGVVLLGRPAHVPPLADAPASRLEARSPFLVVLAEADRQLERGGGLGRKLRVLQECRPLLVRELHATKLERPAPPVRDRRVGRAALG